MAFRLVFIYVINIQSSVVGYSLAAAGVALVIVQVCSLVLFDSRVEYNLSLPFNNHLTLRILGWKRCRFEPRVVMGQVQTVKTRAVVLRCINI